MIRQVLLVRDGMAGASTCLRFSALREDLDTEAEDHIADEARYACMSRPWVPVAYEAPTPPMWTQPLAITTNTDGSLNISHSARELVEQRMRRAQGLLER